MKKIVLLIISVVIVIVAFFSYRYFSYKLNAQDTNTNNEKYERFYQVNVLGTDIASLINKIQDENTKNKIEKDSKGFYINNNKDSIKLDIKFLEKEDKVDFEAIFKEGTATFIKYFGAMEFKCTEIEYHEKTGKIAYMHFIQTK